jgi:hypothetical protein
MGADAISCNLGSAFLYSDSSCAGDAGSFNETVCPASSTMCSSYKHAPTAHGCTIGSVYGQCVESGTTDCASLETAYGWMDEFSCSECSSDNCNSVDPPSISSSASDALKPIATAISLVSLLGAAMLADA